MLISIKDYAKDNGVSYEAVRQQVKRYQNELEGHIHQEGRTQFLDDVAVAILNDHRAKNPTVLYDKGRDETIQQLRKEVDDLTAELDFYKTKLIQTQERLLLTEGAQARLEASESETKILREFLKDAKDEIQVLKDEKTDAVDQVRREYGEKIEELKDSFKQDLQKAKEVAAKDAEGKLHLEQQRADQLEKQLEDYEKRPWWKKIFG